MKRIYISLPISGYDLEERKGYAQRVESALSASYEVVNPLKNGIPETEDWRVHMKKDLQDLLTCDVIFLCKDWEKSKGCKFEFGVASMVGMEIVYEKVRFFYYCKECLFYFYDPFARGRCSHPDVACFIDPYCKSCSRFKMKV